MSKLLAVLIAGVFGMSSFLAYADDTTKGPSPKAPTKEERAMKADEKAKAAAATSAMTPAEKKAARKAKTAKKRAETGSSGTGSDQTPPPMGTSDKSAPKLDKAGKAEAGKAIDKNPGKGQ